MAKILIVEARFYEEIANAQAEAAIAEIERRGFEYERIAVPGSFEIPSVISMAIKSKKYVGYVALGCVIRGETTHYDYVCGECARGLNDLAIKKKAPIGFGVLTVENREQAHKRMVDHGRRAVQACADLIKIKIDLGINNG